MGRRPARPDAGGERPSWSRSPNSTAPPGLTVFGGRSDGAEAPALAANGTAPSRHRALATCMPALSAPRRCAARIEKPGGAAPHRACKSQDRHPECSIFRRMPARRHGGLSPRVRDLSYTLRHASLKAPAIGSRSPRRSTSCGRAPGWQRGPLRHRRRRRRPHSGRLPCPARTLPGADRNPVGPRRPAAPERRRIILVLGAHFGNVFVGLQPAFGYEGDPMRLLFERGFAPTHAFAAFYRWIREDFGAHAHPALRHPWGAGVHAGQASRPVGGLLARPADRRPAELLSLRFQQSVRRHAGQAACRCHADQLSDAAGRRRPDSTAVCSISRRRRSAGANLRPMPPRRSARRLPR